MRIKTTLISMSVVLILLYITSCVTPKTTPIKIDFVTDACLVPQQDNKFKLCDNMIAHVDNQFQVVPRGFKTDLASIPRIMWPVFWPDDYDTIAAAVLHDWHYCCDSEISRQRADDIFYYSLLKNGSSRLKAYIYYVSVRRMGWLYFTGGAGIVDHEKEFEGGELQGNYDDATN